MSSLLSMCPVHRRRFRESMVDGRSTPSRLSAWNFASRMKKPSRRRLSLVPHAQTSRPYRSDANITELRNLPLSRAGTVAQQLTLRSRFCALLQMLICHLQKRGCQGKQQILIPFEELSCNSYLGKSAFVNRPWMVKAN